MSFSVVILSKLASNLVPCVRAVQQHEPDLAGARIIVVDDGARADAEEQLPGIWWTEGIKPFVFARNANLGIRIAAPDDVILLNDDALLETPGGFSGLCRTGEEHPEYGLISAATNVAGNPDQYLKHSGLRETTTLAFVCVLIPRRTIERIGLLDERYVLGYGCEDLDYCEACKRAGLKIGVFDGCYVDHACLQSTFRGSPYNSLPFHRNFALYKEKWGII